MTVLINSIGIFIHKGVIRLYMSISHILYVIFVLINKVDFIRINEADDGANVMD